MRNKRNYNQDWSEYFQVDEKSPSGLMRIKNRVGKSIKGYAVGTQAYTKKSTAHSWRLFFRGELYYIHRIIWVMTYGIITSELVIDHLDGNPFNNNIENLSLKTPADNARNTRQSCINKTGFTGVSLTYKGNCAYYAARWRELDNTKVEGVKYFSVTKLGEEKAKEMAISYREEQILRLIAEGADYTDRHGT